MTHIVRAVCSAENWHQVIVGEVHVFPNPCDLWTAYDHHRSTVVWSEQLNIEIGCSNWKRNLHLEMDLTTDLHCCRRVIDTSFDE